MKNRKIRKIIIIAILLISGVGGVGISLYRSHQKNVVIQHMENHIEYLLKIKELLPVNSTEETLLQHRQEILLLLDLSINEYQSADEIRIQWRIGNSQTRYGATIPWERIKEELKYLVNDQEISLLGPEKVTYVYSDTRNILNYIQTYYCGNEINDYDTIYGSEKYIEEVKPYLNY